MTPDGRVFDALGKKPHVCKDGRQIELTIWQGLCRKCAAPFEVLTPAVFDLEKTDAFGMVHCVEHRLSKDENKARWLAAMQAGRARARAARTKVGGAR